MLKFGLNRHKVPLMRNLSIISLGIVLQLFLGTIAYAQSCASNQLGGLVFRDYDADGAHDSIEPGISGVTVTVFDSAGSTIASGASGTDGTYVLSGVPDGEEYRVEFSDFPTYLKPGAVGTDSATSVIFLTNSSTCSVNMALNNPAEYCETNPYVATPCYVNGDPALSGTAATQEALVAFRYNENGAASSSTANAPTHLGLNSEIGPTWGTAFQKSGHKIFSAALMKRHSGFGPLGTGGLYVTDVTNINSPVVSNFVNLQTLGISTGSDPHSGLPANIITPNTDDASFAAVGFVAFGDMDISEDETTLWLVNLANKTLYSIFIDLPAVAPDVSDLTSFPIPNPGCTNSDYVPWAIEIKDGKVYVGVTCTALTSQLSSDIAIHILRLDGSSFTTIFSSTLAYTKGPSIHPLYSPLPGVTNWQPWADLFTTIYSGAYAFPVFFGYPQPLLIDMEIDADNSWILGLGDRSGHQFGDFNYAPGGTEAIVFPSSGDLLRACPNGSGGWDLESNGSCGGVSTAGAGNSEGPGGGEFYFEDFINTGTVIVMGSPLTEHSELALGGLALREGSNEIMTSAFDPVATYETGGTITFSSLSGDRTRNYEVYPSFLGSSGKAAGVGDLELLCEPSPIEIGNRVWFDTDEDGIQDAAEPPVSGVTVNLYTSMGTLVATTTTDSQGRYYFKASDGLLTNTTYRVALNNPTDYGVSGALVGYKITSINQGQDLNDSDAALVSGYPSISLTTGTPGDNDHTFDFGFVRNCNISSLASLSLGVDSSAFRLKQITNTVVRTRRSRLATRHCGRTLSRSEESSALTTAATLYMEIWADAYSFNDSRYTCTQSDPLCTTINNTTTIDTIRRSARKVYNRIVRLLQPRCLGYSRPAVTRSKARAARNAVYSNAAQIPTSQTVCTFSY